MARKMDEKVMGAKYRGAIAIFRRQLPGGDLRLAFEQEIDAWFRRCALALWSRGNGVTQDHVGVYNAIVSGGNKPPKMLYFELCSAAAAPPPFAPPGFYHQLCTQSRDRAGQFCDLCEMVFALLLTADGGSESALALAKDWLNRLGREAGRPAKPGAPEKPDPIRPVGAAGGPEAPVNPAGPAAAQEEAEAAREADKEEEKPQPTFEELMAELDSLCGLEKVKKDVRSLVNLVKIRKLREEEGLPTPAMSLHLVFMGNPGTGKTTVARLLAGIYRAIGVLPKGQLVEVDRSGLVAGYVGQTAIQTQKVIQSAMGGVLFIDEAYALASQPGTNDFGQEAIDTILKAMEDHRKELVVIVAGYTELMMKFIGSNPGLESRFNKYIYFDDYEGRDLEAIFYSTCKKNGYESEPALKEKLLPFFNEWYENRDENFGNARDVRNLFERLVAVQSDRVAMLEAPTREDLMKITLADFQKAEEEETGEGPREPGQEEKAPEKAE